MQVPIKDVRVGKRLRGLREGTVAELVESIGRMGLQVPISVAKGIAKREGGGADLVAFDLVAGHHRLEACRRLGWEEIEANIVQMSDDERLLWEIDENLCRADLTELERGEHLAKRKPVYERLYPQAKHGGDRRSDEFQVENSSVRSFADDTAEKIGVTDRAIRQSIRRATKIDEKVRDRVRELPEIADSGVELDALAALDPQQQRKAVALVESGQAVGIRDAKKLMEPKPPKVTPHFKGTEQAREKRRNAFVKALGGLHQEDHQWARDLVDEMLDKPVADSTSALRAGS